MKRLKISNFSVKLEGGFAPSGIGKALSSSCWPLTTQWKWLSAESMATQLCTQVFGSTEVELGALMSDCLSIYKDQLAMLKFVFREAVNSEKKRFFVKSLHKMVTPVPLL